jgi:hypothetical protein
MLRHIVSVGLAMTACATLMPTKANAATLTVTPIGSLQKKPGESITFIFSLNPAPFEGFNSFTFQELFYDYDGTELSLRKEEIEPPNTIVNNTRTIATITFDVLQGVKKDGQSDLFGAYALYNEGGKDDPTTNTPDATGTFDVQPVPEPLTIFGTALGLGCGVLFKRKSFKKTLS